MLQPHWGRKRPCISGSAASPNRQAARPSEKSWTNAWTWTVFPFSTVRTRWTDNPDLRSWPPRGTTRR
ncbi:hypothetical protein D1872_333420 [compost metagenome]